MTLCCPNCKHLRSKVLPTKMANTTNGRVRKRECLKCQKQFLTVETIHTPTVKQPKKEKPAKQPKKQKFKKRAKVEELPDFSKMTDQEIEDYFYSDD